MLHWISTDPSFLSVILFSDEATFHQPEKVILYDIRGSRNSHIYQELVQYTYEMNVWCGLMKDKIARFFLRWKLQ
jgi:predicted alpha/beta-fold hydrolase